MSCANITAGWTNDCRDSQGGIESFYIANGPVESITETAGNITAITVGGSALAPADFFEFQTPRAVSSITENTAASLENGTVTYEQVATIIANKMTAEKRNQLLLLAEATTLVVIAKDNNGIYWSIGTLRGAYLTAATGTTGAGFADRNGLELTINGMEKQPMFTVDSSIVVA